ncbi:MAG: hypothetical protein PHT40_00945 [Patescibacteria group bacterium]|nr:hypothetical protein [Patescibacteria group bacterium]
MTRKKKICLFLVLLTVLFLMSCAGPNPSVNTPSAKGSVAGFWTGYWHGLIAPIAFLASLSDHSVHFYEVHNNGDWYNLGFLIGISVIIRLSWQIDRRIDRLRLKSKRS